MNAPQSRAESTALTTIDTPATYQTSALMLSPQLMQQMMAVAQAMSEAAITVPLHFRGKPGDCLAVVMQATQWNMNPFAVAQKTHVVNGALGYEAQLVHAVLQATGAIEGTFTYEYRNEGTTNLECRVAAVCKGDGTKLTWGEWLSCASVTTKNSPLWKTNPKQQMGYLQVKNWARAFKPGAILGVYSTDELEAPPPTEKHMGAADVVKPDPTTGELPMYPEADFDKNLASWRKAIEGKKKTADEVIGTVETKGRLTDTQKARIRGDVAKAEATDAEPKFTYAQVADRIGKAADRDAVAIARDLIASISDEQQRADLHRLADEREAELAKA